MLEVCPTNGMHISATVTTRNDATHCRSRNIRTPKYKDAPNAATTSVFNA
jgi:hypothetical protein